ncbi:MAG: ABC transporter substrate-binding protein [Chloroflexi bacterium]|nr:ABC transporter substrate-binding protein [Chloroflexota bacterium]
MLKQAALFGRRAALLGVVGLLVACQQPTSPPKPSDATPVPPRPTPQPTATLIRPVGDPKPAARATPQAGPPRPGGALVWATDSDPLDLDPHAGGSVTGAAAWADLTYQSLVMFDEQMRLAPALAEAWVMTDPTTWTFTLRQGVRFHDGSELEAEDVRAWFDRLRAPETNSPHRGWYSQVVKVEPRGRYEVTFTLNAPYAPLLATLASLRGSAIAPRRWLSRAPDTKLRAVGSGPYRIVAYVPGSHVAYEKHADYWERGLPLLDRLTMRIVPAEAARIEQLRAAAADRAAAVDRAAAADDAVTGAGGLSEDTAKRLRTDRTLTVLASASASQTITTLNTRRAPFDDLRVRQALALAADRRAALSRLLGEDGQLTGPIPTGFGSWALALEDLPTRRDVPQARRLLAEAGHADGFEAAIRTGEDALSKGVSALLADQLREVGITLRVEPLPAAEFARAVQARDFELVTGKLGFLPDPDAYLSGLYHSHGGQNAAGWSSKAFDDLVNAARTVMDPGQRKALYDEASNLLLAEAPAIWWFTEHTLEAVSSTLRGYAPAFSGRRAALKGAWIAR